MPVTDYYEYQDLFEECGCCGHFHRPEFRGDCRNDLERFSASDLEEQFTRRAETDSELQAMGAVVIQVKDLGAAMEAIEVRSRAIEAGSVLSTRPAYALRLALEPRLSGFEVPAPAWLVRRAANRCAAHLARRALGDAS